MIRSDPVWIYNDATFGSLARPGDLITWKMYTTGQQRAYQDRVVYCDRHVCSEGVTVKLLKSSGKVIAWRLDDNAPGKIPEYAFVTLTPWHRSVGQSGDEK